MTTDYTIGREIPADTIPARSALILWRADLSGGEVRVRDVLVLDYEENRRNRERYRCLGSSAGAAFTMWMNPSAADGQNPIWSTPAGTFGWLTALGFADTHELQNAVVQFARIEGCTWAQRMLYAYDSEDIAKIREEAADRLQATQAAYRAAYPRAVAA